MTLSLEDAFDLFSSWKKDSLKVRVDLTAGKPGRPDNPLPIRAHLTGSVIAVDPSNAPGTVTVQGDNCGLELDLRGCRFSRRKPRDPPEFGGPAFAAQFETALAVVLPTGEYFLFLAFARGN